MKVLVKCHLHEIATCKRLHLRCCAFALKIDTGQCNRCNFATRKQKN